jgi:hypothetical protein
MKKYERTGIMAYHNELWGTDMYDVTRGNYIDNWDERVTFNFTTDNGYEITDYICNDFGWPIVSNKFKMALESVGISGIQYLPLIIVNKDTGITLERYYVANIYNLVEAVDMKKSEYFELIPGKYCFVSFAVKEDKIKNFDIFRLKENDVNIFVSEKFQKVIKSNKLTGFDFTKITVV